MKLKWIVWLVALGVVTSICAYALPYELALVMAGDVLTYLELAASVYLLSRTSPVAGLLAMARGVARDRWEKLQLSVAEGMARCVPAFVPPHA